MTGIIDTKIIEDKTIYVCRNQDFEIWKLSVDLLKKSMVAPFFWDNFIISSLINKDGYVLLWFDNYSQYLKNILFEALNFYKFDIEFDKISLQKEFDELDENDKEEIIYYSGEILENLGIDSEQNFPADLKTYFNSIFDSFGEYSYVLDVPFDWDEYLCNFEKEEENKIVELKKLNKKYKAREKKYRNLGCEILKGFDALKAINGSFSYSMFAVDTDEIYCVEYSGSTYFCSDLDVQDFYTVRKYNDNQMTKEVLWSFMLPIGQYMWAIKKYHTGIRLDHPDC